MINVNSGLSNITQNLNKEFNVNLRCALKLPELSI